MRCRAVPVLYQAVGDPSSVVRVATLQALARDQPGSTPERPMVMPGGPGLLRAAKSPDAYLRWKAAWWVRGHRDLRFVLDTMLGDVDSDVRRQAARSLGILGDPGGVEPLIGALDDSNSFVRRWALEALGAPGRATAAQAVRPFLDSDTVLEAAAAAEALTRLGEPTEVPRYEPPRPPSSPEEIATLATSPDVTVRKDLAKFLAGDPAHLAVLEGLARDGDSEVRKTAVEALGWTEGTTSALQRALQDPDTDVMVTALQGLRRSGTGDLVEVRKLLKAQDSELRLRAAEALAAARREADGDAVLATLAADPDERIRAAVVAALPDRLAADEPAVLVRRAAAAHGRTLPGEADALVLAALPDASPALASWARGVLAREDDLLHALFSWNDPADRPAEHRSLRPPVIRPYGSPDRG